MNDWSDMVQHLLLEERDDSRRLKVDLGTLFSGVCPERRPLVQLLAFDQPQLLCVSFGGIAA